MKRRKTSSYAESRSAIMHRPPPLAGMHLLAQTPVDGLFPCISMFYELKSPFGTVKRCTPSHTLAFQAYVRYATRQEEEEEQPVTQHLASRLTGNTIFRNSRESISGLRVGF